jgi:segregation and condensation protein B
MRRRWGPTNAYRHPRPPWRMLPYGHGASARCLLHFPRKVENLKEFSAEESDSHPETALMRVEAVLVICRQPLTNRKLAQLAGLADATEARTLIRQLNDRYDRTGRAVRIEQVAGGYILLTRPQLAPWLRRLKYLPSVVRLTPPVLETLAIVAYRQPVLRVDVEAIRGTACGEILRQLMQRDLIRISGRSEELGRPFLYSTTHRFLQTFGLQNIESLPHTDWFQSVAEIPETNEATTEIFDNPDSADKECKVSIRLAAALQETDFLDDVATGIAVVEAPDSSSQGPVAVEEDDDDFEEEDDEFADDEEDEEEFEEEDEEFEEEEEEFEEDEWEEVEGEEEEEDDEEGEWEEEEFEEEDDEFEEEEVEGDDEEVEEEEDEEWD